ncbi:hypothetical protein [Bradyrhizobium sp. Tv2a-2]|uniref:hypothetical protein n=1 Tax=Bradyrhizobium sp. Tv2a-2 TaxID=113395 RepID=UPI000410351D|nr:hypothetical protein [Bradyrhizobium sp. Tv2a-2]
MKRACAARRRDGFSREEGLAILQEGASEAAHDTSPISYAYRASLIGAAHRFELTDAGLAWHLARRSAVWAYADIAAIRLSFRPVSMQAHRFRADIRHVDGGRITILSTSWQTAALMAPQDNSFRVFISSLHARMKEAGSGAVLTGGLSRRTYIAALALVALLAVAMSGLLIRALATQQFAGAAFMLGFAALFSWQVGGFIRRNQPLAYTFESIPTKLLP